MVYLSNSFSFQMLDVTLPNTIHETPVTAKETAEALKGGFVSAVGHADTACVLSGMLGLDVACNRVNVRLTAADVLYVAQVTGGRLPEGATTLPDGMTIQFMRITLRNEAIAEAIRISDTSWTPQYVNPDMGAVLDIIDTVHRLLKAD